MAGFLTTRRKRAMKRFQLSASVEDEGGDCREFKVELVPAGDQYQPVVTVKDGRTGFSNVTHLPISDYKTFREKISKFSSLDSKDMANAVRRIISMISLVG